jgi:hypothetical protein
VKTDGFAALVIGRALCEGRQSGGEPLRPQSNIKITASGFALVESAATARSGQGWWEAAGAAPRAARLCLRHHYEARYTAPQEGVLSRC